MRDYFSAMGRYANFSGRSSGAAVLLMALLGPAQAMQGPPRTSDFELKLDHAFNWTQGGRTSLPSGDCTFAADAQAFFQAEVDEGNTIQVLEHAEAKVFVGSAYRGRINFVDYANLDFIAVEKRKDGTYRVYPGSLRIMSVAQRQNRTIFCGFEQPQVLSAEWAEAGLQNKTLYTTVPDPTPFENNLEQLNLGYAEEAYVDVRDSLEKRGYTAVEQKDAAIDRCSPGLEKICEAFPEAACRQNYGGKSCAFEWRASTGEHLAVEAQVGFIGNNAAEITVSGVEKFDPAAK